MTVERHLAIHVFGYLLAARKRCKQWHWVACWGKVAEQATGIRKGDVVTVEGQLRTRSYDKGGEKRYVTEVVAKSVVVDAQDRQPQVERDDAPPIGEDDIPF